MTGLLVGHIILPSGPNFIELLNKQKKYKKNVLLSRTVQDTSHKLYLWHDILNSYQIWQA